MLNLPWKWRYDLGLAAPTGRGAPTLLFAVRVRGGGGDAGLLRYSICCFRGFVAGLLFVIVRCMRVRYFPRFAVLQVKDGGRFR